MVQPLDSICCDGMEKCECSTCVGAGSRAYVLHDSGCEGIEIQFPLKKSEVISGSHLYVPTAFLR